MINGEVYLKIFYHDVDKGGFFDSVAQAKYNLDENRYSIISNITDEFRDSDGKFTFLILYPTFGRYNIWQQSNFPLQEPKFTSSREKLSPVEGFNSIKTFANHSEINCTWGGLVLTNYPYYLLDGCPNGINWNFAIGYTGANTVFPDSIPADVGTTKIVSLWMKSMQDKAIYLDSCKLFNCFRFSISYPTFILLVVT
ncbi:hypothetical protein TVAG_240310 [Trichomonas vaginalis G3]|uniref:Uncharacterized protein n=1 Tax=Trichomonas vaginalis (strain ATCC PRA-98 / G3) TaxID=412133 RepID=A2GRM8_TRIV3|nr:hypothetical protein TVAGG3_0780290 [Trichomonas vaginalis G3]EAX80188.1 hypothetical protein TVAG_240310 [Trichomonas vaginalis G3]KAI5494996.1 hypothetical protein TVAGG3_0780290 [Trichomonas vaginalis G3]|eukprot:XP_001293118.1 hypothetical protein [Trichomonas vaginalis G3]